MSLIYILEIALKWDFQIIVKKFFMIYFDLEKITIVIIHDFIKVTAQHNLVTSVTKIDSLVWICSSFAFSSKQLPENSRKYLKNLNFLQYLQFHLSTIFLLKKPILSNFIKCYVILFSFLFEIKVFIHSKAS